MFVSFPGVEVGYNNSIIALHVVEDDEKEPGVRWYNWATLSLGDIHTGTWSSRLGVGHKTDDLAA
jgi:hypothetical protein